MRYSADYKHQKRLELLKTTGRLAKQQGFATTGVDAFMKAAHMTSGAFYSHFSSKNELFKALISSELHQSLADWQTNPHQEPEAWLEFEMARYLAPSHLKHASHGCMIPSLAVEIGRAEPNIKQLFEQELLKGHQLFSQHLGDENKAWAVLSQMIGAIVLARSLADPKIQMDILTASKSMIRAALVFKQNDSIQK